MLEKILVILVTHKSSLLSLVDRLILVDNGKVVLDGEKNKVLAQLQGKSGGAKWVHKKK